MFPWPFPAEEDADPGRDAEKLIYTLCDEKLPQDCSVVYSVSWLGKDRDGRAQQGEADFCLIDDARGIVVLEVKGGGISRDAESGTWISIDRYGKRHRIKDPARQAQRSMFALRDKLRSLPAWSRHRVQLGYAVAFPSVKQEASVALPPDMPRAIVILGVDLKSLDAKIEAIFDYWDRATHGESAVSPALVQQVMELLSPTFELRTTLGHQVQADAAKVLELTAQQVKAFNILRGVPRVAVRGVAGSGKTIIALEQARRLAGEGFRTLLTCFNRPLAEDLIAQTAGVDGIVCDTFHSFCETMARQAEVSLPVYPDGAAPPEYFNEILPGALAEALDRRPEDRFDAIIVDEGQDFHPDWLALLELAQGRAHEGVFFLFYDEAQEIYGRKFELPANMVPATLDENLRTTRTIHETALRICPSAGEAGGPDGRAVEFIVAEDPKAVQRELGRVLHRLIREQDVAPGDIAILAGRSTGRSSLAGVETVGAFRIGGGAGGGDDSILFESIHRFKGLERPVVILIDLAARMDEAPGLVYVGVTRALSHLVVVDTEAVLARLGNGEL